MRYNLGVGVDKNWTMTEEVFIQELLGKCEAVMSLGNGYMGIRSATEESYVGEVRNTFVAVVDINSVKDWCNDNVFDEDHAHGVRNLVQNAKLLSPID